MIREDALSDNALTVRIRRAGGVFEASIYAVRSETKVGSVELAKDDSSRLFRVERSYVEPAYQRRGVGRAAYEKIDAWARDNYGYRLASDLSLSEPARKLWQGFQAQGKATLVGPNNASFYVMEMGKKNVWLRLLEATRPNPIKGGVGDRLGPGDVSWKELLKGVADEREHSPDPEVEADIAFDHLAQDKKYYSHRPEDGDKKGGR